MLFDLTHEEKRRCLRNKDSAYRAFVQILLSHLCPSWVIYADFPNVGHNYTKEWEELLYRVLYAVTVLDDIPDEDAKKFREILYAGGNEILTNAWEAHEEYPCVIPEASDGDDNPLVDVSQL